MLYSTINFTDTFLSNINNFTNIESDSEKIYESQILVDEKRELIILYAKKTFLSIVNLDATEFNGQLIFLESASHFNLSLSEISKG